MQYAIYDSDARSVSFETRHVNGQLHRFKLSKNQFLALNDAILIINQTNRYGHYPLGQQTWMHYNAFDASLYRDVTNTKRINFIFISFSEYKRFTQKRLLSLVRSNERRRACDENRLGRYRQRLKSAISKRPSSIAMQSSDRSPASKRACRRKRHSSSTSTDNGDLPNDSEASAILPEWNCASARWRSDSKSSTSSTTQDTFPAVSYPSPSLQNSSDEMDCE